MEQAHCSRGPAARTLLVIQLESYSGAPLGDLVIDCEGCGRQLTAPDKLSAIVRDGRVRYHRGRFSGFCYNCTQAVIV